MEVSPPNKTEVLIYWNLEVCSNQYLDKKDKSRRQ